MKLFPSKNKILYLHLGLHKTATTSIQKTLYNNIGILKKSGIHYLKSFEFNHSVPFCIAFSNNDNLQLDLRVSQVSEKELKYRKKRFFKKLSDELNDIKNKNIVISGEDIVNLSAQSLNKIKTYFSRVLPNHSLRVIIYLRNPISYITSSKQQVIKLGHGGLNKITIEHIKQKIGKIISVFGGDAVQFVSFEKACEHPFGPVGVFLELIGFPRQKIKKINQYRENTSLSYQAIEVVEYINKQYPIIQNNVVNPGRLRNDTAAFHHIKGEKYFLSIEEQTQFIGGQLENLQAIKELTGIDYTNIEVSHFQKPAYSVTYANEFVEAFNQSNSLIRFFAFQFIESKLNENLPLNQIEMFKKIKQKLQSDNPDVNQSPFEKIQIETDTLNRLRNFIANANSVSDFEMFREISFFMDGFGEAEQALTFLERALEIRPNNQPLLKIHNDLKEKIENK